MLFFCTCSLQLDGIPEADAAWLMQQLVCAVEFCHRMGVANRDIKVRPLIACCIAPA